MADPGSGRWKQKRRTRKALLEAANRLLTRGSTPSLEAVADEALVSRATAYRYFASAEALVREAALDVAMPDPASLFAGDDSADPVARLERADRALHAMVSANEVPLRLMLANALAERARNPEPGAPPVRQNRRSGLIETALAPVANQIKPSELEMLSAALALVIGTEAMVVFRDVLQIDDAKAEKVRHWAIQALVTAALKAGKQGN